MVNEDYIIAQPVCAQMTAPRLQLLHMFGRQEGPAQREHGRSRDLNPG
jgi:hypothetical protein